MFKNKLHQTSAELQDKNDRAYHLKGKAKPSRAKKLFKEKGSLRHALILQEILKRPY
jgi:hypothetical protein